MFKKKESRPYEVGDKVIVKEIKNSEWYSHIQGWSAEVVQVLRGALYVKFDYEGELTVPDYVFTREVKLSK